MFWRDAGPMIVLWKCVRWLCFFVKFFFEELDTGFEFFYGRQLLLKFLNLYIVV